MAGETLQLYVLCRTELSRDAWGKQAEAHPDLEVTPIFPVLSAVGTIRSLAAAAGRPFLVCQDGIWLGIGIAAQVAVLVGELDGRFSNWALCGNRGMRWDGQHLFDYAYAMDRAGLRTAVCPHPVICLDDRLLLVNPAAFRRHTRFAPSLKRFQSGVPLSLECLQNGSLLAASPRLMAMHPGPDGSDGEPAIETDPEFMDYYRRAFLDHYYPTPDGPLNMSELLDYRQIAEPRTKPVQREILDLFDGALEKSRGIRKPSLTICCRTQFGRPEMLERAVLSFAVWRNYAGQLADVRVQLITDQPRAVAEPQIYRLSERYPGAALGCWYHEIRPNRFSRADLLLAAIERADTDYIWFIDDDDYVAAPVAPAVARSLVSDAPVLVVGSSAVLKETWRRVAAGGEGDSGEDTLEMVQAERLSSYEAGQVFRVLRGFNRIPICGMILPVAPLRQRIRRVQALGNYNEDYFILLLALTSPRIEVCVLNTEIASISLRGNDNTVFQEDSAGWHLSLATFLLEVLNDTEGNSPFLWQLVESLKW
jgi:hypothetical protein